MKGSVFLFLLVVLFIEGTVEALVRPHVTPSMSVFRHNACPSHTCSSSLAGFPPSFAEEEDKKRQAKLIAQSTNTFKHTAPPPAPPKSNLVKQLGPVLLSALCVAALMYPLDLVRALQMANSGSGTKLTTMQLLSNFKDTHGVQGFFTQGLAPELARSTWMRLLKFGLFPIIHEKLTGLPEKQGTPQTKAVAAILASVPEAISIMPLEIAKINLQLDTQKRFGNSMFAAMGSVMNEAGPAGFAVGYPAIQARQALWTAGYFASIGFFEEKVNNAIKTLYDMTHPPAVPRDPRDPVLLSTPPPPSPPEFKLKDHKALQVTSQLVSGFLAGVFGAVLNTPFDTIRTTVQKRLLSPAPLLPGTPTSILGVGQEILAARGIGGLYAGFQFKAFHLGGGGALMAYFVPFFTKMFAHM